MAIQLINDDYRSANLDREVDLIISDPPYCSTNLDFDKRGQVDYLEWLVWCKEKMKASGVLVSFCDLRLLSTLMSYKKFSTQYELVWKKNAPVGFLQSGFRPLMKHEFIVVMADKIKSAAFNPQKEAGDSYKKGASGSVTKIYSNQKNRCERKQYYEGRFPTTIITCLTDKDRSNSSVEKQDRHPTQKPLDLVKKLVLTYSNEGDLVVDTFSGSGTTALACKLTNRDCIAFEIDKGYHDMAGRKLNENT